MQNVEINYQSCIISKSIDGVLSIETILLDQIRNGNILTNCHIQKARTAGKGSEIYSDIKQKKLPAFTFNFLYENTIADKNITTPTGLYYLDIDGINTETELEDVKKGLAKLPFVYSCWKSLSERGLSILLAVDGLTKENYNHFKDYIIHLYEENSPMLGAYKFDRNAFKPSQKTVLSRDENIYVNTDSSPLLYTDVFNYLICNGLLSDRSIYKGDSTKVPYTLLENKKENIVHYMAPMTEKQNENKILFSNKTLFLDKDLAYDCFPNGIETVELYINPCQRIPEGHRSKTLFQWACKLIYINQCNACDIYSLLLSFRDKYFDNPESMPDKQVMEIANSAQDKCQPEKIAKKIKKILFSDSCGYNPRQKQSISGREMGKIKIATTTKRLADIYQPGMKQTELIKQSGLSKRTVARYWNDNGKGNITIKYKGAQNKLIASNVESVPATDIIYSDTPSQNPIELMNEEYQKSSYVFMGRESSELGIDYFGNSASKKPNTISDEELKRIMDLDLSWILEEEIQPVQKIDNVNQIIHHNLEDLLFEIDIEESMGQLEEEWTRLSNHLHRAQTFFIP
jgi:VirE N-terminal domain